MPCDRPFRLPAGPGVLEDRPGVANALAAAGAGAGAGLQFLELGAGAGVVPEVAVGDAVAEADDHGAAVGAAATAKAAA